MKINPSKSEVIGRGGGDEKTNDHAEPTNTTWLYANAFVFKSLFLASYDFGKKRKPDRQSLVVRGMFGGQDNNQKEKRERINWQLVERRDKDRLTVGERR